MELYEILNHRLVKPALDRLPIALDERLVYDVRETALDLYREARLRKLHRMDYRYLTEADDPGPYEHVELWCACGWGMREMNAEAAERRFSEHYETARDQIWR